MGGRKGEGGEEQEKGRGRGRAGESEREAGEGGEGGGRREKEAGGTEGKGRCIGLKDWEGRRKGNYM